TKTFTMGVDDGDGDKFKIGTTAIDTNTRLTIDSSGNIGIGTTAPDSIKLDVEDDIEVGTGTTGCVRDADNTTLIGTCVSDVNLKKNISSLSGILGGLSQLRPVSFEWRNDEYEWLNGQVGINYGLIAQEVETVFPEMVHIDDKGYKRVAYDIALSMRLLQGIKEITSVIDMSSAPIASSSITIDNSGNIGIGTVTPAYKLHVIGDVAATSFVNISTKEAKKDIEYLAETDDDDIFEKIKSAKIAKYRYNEENNDDPLRIGLIAEEAPEEVLSKDKKGVDVYKMTTFLMSGLKALNKKVETTVSASYNAISSGYNAVVTKISKLTVGSAEQPTGITLYDRATKEPYCSYIENGYWKQQKGKCEDILVELNFEENNTITNNEQNTETQNTNTQNLNEGQNISEPENIETVEEEPVELNNTTSTEEIVIDNATTTN
ncbi:MAG: tail fiber domain-containing protein, partial [Patescibacteria group bacterium]